MGSKAKRSPGTSTSGGEGEGAAPRIDQVLSQLEQVVEALESGDLPLEQALASFEEGVALARLGGTMLDGIEERVEILLARGETVPFTAVEDEDHDGEV